MSLVCNGIFRNNRELMEVNTLGVILLTLTDRKKKTFLFLCSFVCCSCSFGQWDKKHSVAFTLAFATY